MTFCETSDVQKKKTSLEGDGKKADALDTSLLKKMSRAFLSLVSFIYSVQNREDMKGANFLLAAKIRENFKLIFLLTILQKFYPWEPEVSLHRTVDSEETFPHPFPVSSRWFWASWTNIFHLSLTFSHFRLFPSQTLNNIIIYSNNIYLFEF